MSFHSLPEALEHWARISPSKVALRFVSRHAVGEQLTYDELARRSRAIAEAAAKQARPGERALLIYPPGLGLIPAFLGCLEAGVVAVPANPPHLRRGATRAVSIYRDCRPRLVLSNGKTHGRLRASGLFGDEVGWLATDLVEESGGRREANRRETVTDINPDSTAFLQYTSGSTSSPRGVVVKHRHLESNFRQIIAAFGLDASWFRPVSWGPMHHDLGLILHALLPLHMGATATLMSPLEFLQSPVAWLRAMMDFDGTFCVAPNFAYELCVDRIPESLRTSLDLSGWRVAGNGSERVRWRTMQRFEEAYKRSGFREHRFFPCYGLAEATLIVSGGPVARPVATTGHPELGQIGASGQPARDCQVLIVDARTREPSPTGQIGEIWVRSDSVAAGYWQRPEASQATFGSELAAPKDSGKTYLRTGDLGFLDAEGYLFVTGRIKELIILHGRNLYPQDLEVEVAAADDSFEPDGAAAFSVEVEDKERLIFVQEIRRSKLKAFEPKKALAAVRGSLSAAFGVSLHAAVFIRPRTLPRTSSGKIRRLACREDYVAGRLEEVRIDVSTGEKRG